jgi:hypothetical protein
MVLLRATQRVLRQLPPMSPEFGESDTALGDWYVNRLVVDRRPLLLLVSSHSLLPMVVPAREVRTLPNPLPGLVRDRLLRQGIPVDQVEAEVRAMNPVVVSATRDRSVIGTLNEFTKDVPYHLPVNGWSESDLAMIELHMSEMPCRVSRRFEDTICPDRKTPELLAARWAPGGTG